MSAYVYIKPDTPAIKISGAEIVYQKRYGRFININGTYIKNGSIYIQTENDSCLISSFYGNYWEIRLSTSTLAADVELVATCNSTGSEFPLTGQWTWSDNITKYTSRTINLITTETSMYKKPLSDATVYTSPTESHVLKSTDRIFLNKEWYYVGLSEDDFYTGDLTATLTTGRILRARCVDQSSYGTDRIWETYQGGISRSVSSNEERSLNGILNIHYSTSDMKWICYFEDNMTYGSGGKQPWQCRYISSDTAFDETIPVSFVNKVS